MSWNSSAYTALGSAMLTEALSGKRITFTRAVGGAGTVQTAELPNATEVADQKQSLILSSGEMTGEGENTAYKIKIQISNNGLQQGYTLHQIGIYAKLDDSDSDALAVIFQDDHGFEIQPEAAMNNFLMEFFGVLAISNTAQIYLTADPNAIATEAWVRKLLAEQGSSGTIIKDITIPADGWDWQRESDDEEMLGMDDFRWVVDVAVDDVTEDMFPSVALHKAALEVAKRAGLCPTVQANAGVLRFWARNAPEADMAATVALVSPSGASGGGSSSYVLPVATATRLGGVKIGSGVSVSADGTISASTSGITQDEVVSAADTDKMLDEIFPAES